ncbi:MAG: arylamine N-acetyltransferase, partial [Gammaproteobacteria bacterium]|nr:arylamine N-acetyltransferase [Gammaproteobacteria bacterium]
MRPSSDVFDAGAYLRRIGLAAAPAQTIDGLIELCRAQALAIPFENFDVLINRPLELTPAGLSAKLVQRRRGGYCFELNGLLLAALRVFGFQARRRLARVHVTGSPSGRTHQLCIVNCGGIEWLADAGFGGDGLLMPIPMEPGRIEQQAGEHYRLVTDPLFGTILQIQRGSDWQPLYSFDGSHVTGADIALGHHYTSTHP